MRALTGPVTRVGGIAAREAAISTAASAGDTVHTGLQSAYREPRNALLEAKNKLASSHS
jgi:hypothetical protein